MSMNILVHSTHSHGTHCARAAQQWSFANGTELYARQHRAKTIAPNQNTREHAINKQIPIIIRYPFTRL